MEFKAIDLERDFEIAISFRADSFYCSFFRDDAFWGEDRKGGERYLAWLKEQNSNSFGAFHLWEKGEIIAQLELSLLNTDKSWGYVNLYYLRADKRGRGYSKYLDDFATSFLKSLSVSRAKLSVSPTNTRAVSYYEKNGWVDKGARFLEQDLSERACEQVNWMEKIF